MMIDYIMRLDALIDVCIGCNEEFPNEPCEPNDCKIKRALSGIPTADVRKNVHAQKVIGGGERDGATCWFECSICHGSVDIEDAYCKHCGAVLEYEK